MRERRKVLGVVDVWFVMVVIGGLMFGGLWGYYFITYFKSL